jgi:hypothetical protein
LKNGRPLDDRFDGLKRRKKIEFLPKIGFWPKTQIFAKKLNFGKN